MLSPLVTENLASLEIRLALAEVTAVTEVKRPGNDTEVIGRSKSEQAVAPSATEDLDLAEELTHIMDALTHFQISGRALSHEENFAPELMPWGCST
jgi:hypothetical protein